MDPFSKRLRKQRERSSLHARQMNKNVSALLNRQLHVLERRQQRNARALMRTKQAILQELTNEEKPEYERDTKAKVKADQASSARSSYRYSLPTASTQLKQCPNPNKHSPQPQDHVDSSDALISFPGPHFHHGSPQATTNSNSGQVCRFRALSPINPCLYFPCRRPLTYNYMRVSHISNAGPAEMKGSPMTNGLHSDSTDTGPSNSHGKDGKTGGGSSACGGGGVTAGMWLVKDEHVSPRTTIIDRLRGLRELVRELREKNERKRPRDWVTNYGEPVSRRLLRKPVVPVSDE